MIAVTTTCAQKNAVWRDSFHERCVRAVVITHLRPSGDDT
jgi:hypothetical protein